MDVMVVDKRRFPGHWEPCLWQRKVEFDREARKYFIFLCALHGLELRPDSTCVVSLPCRCFSCPRLASQNRMILKQKQCRNPSRPGFNNARKFLRSGKEDFS